MNQTLWCWENVAGMRYGHHDVIGGAFRMVEELKETDGGDSILD